MATLQRDLRAVEKGTSKALSRAEGDVTKLAADGSGGAEVPPLKKSGSHVHNLSSV